MKYDYDVIIIGGGLAGLTLTCLLAQSNIHAACIDRSHPRNLITMDERTTAISYRSHETLNKSGIWSVLKNRTSPILTIDILDNHSPILMTLSNDDIDEDAFGWVVDNRDLRASLYDRIEKLPYATSLFETQVTSLNVTDTHASAICDDGNRYTARLIIGADGRQSSVRDFIDSPVHEKDYAQTAITCIITHETPHHGRAVEHFKPHGPLAVLPMRDDKNGQHRSSIVLTHKTQDIASYRVMNDATFTIYINEILPASYGHITMAGTRKYYPLTLNHAVNYTAPRIALMADAAHGLHPIAGQGLNLGLRDAAYLADLITNDPLNIGSPAMLNAYESKRRPDAVSFLAFTDGLDALFSSSFLPINIARKIGLKAGNKNTFLKNKIIKKAMGL